MQPDWLKDVESGQGDRPHSVRAEVSNAMVGLMEDFYGKDPTKAKTFLNDNYVFCVMEGGLTRNEETLIERGHEDLVRTYRLRFQEAMEEPTVEAIQRITGRSVIGYHSQIVFNPERAVRSCAGPPRRVGPSTIPSAGSLLGRILARIIRRREGIDLAKVDAEIPVE